MKPRTHQCAAKGCQHTIALHLLMCMDHWRMVPVAHRRTVNQTYKNAVDYPSSETLDAHTDAVADAIAAVQFKQVEKNTARAALEGDLFGSPEPGPGQQLQPETQHVLRHRRTGRGEPFTPERS